jgi:osmotically-inducible protein OsmY
MLDLDLVDRVSRELYWDPSIDSAAVAISAEGGRVTLRGTVGGVHERHWVKEAVERVPGVDAVENHLQVRHLTRRGRRDAELRGRVLQELMLSTVIPSTVDAYATQGFVTLTGSAQRQPIREAAERLARNVPGVTGILDEIVIQQPEPTADELAADAQAAAVSRRAVADGTK